MSDAHGAITGFHAIEEALRRSRGGGTLLLADDRKRNRALRALAAARGVRTVSADVGELEQVSGTVDHRGAAYLPGGAEVSPPGDLRAELRRLGEGPRLVVVLDHLSDPHNLGAVLRSADQFAADLVVLPERRSAPLTPAVARASAGASAHVRAVVVSNVASSLRLLKESGFWIYGAHLDGERLDQVRFPERAALVLGSEGRGLAELVARSCDVLVRIPSRGTIDSLNVSVAAGILMYEIRRSQGFLGDPGSVTRGT